MMDTKGFNKAKEEDDSWVLYTAVYVFSSY
jgi:hypothetical protein